MLDPSNEARLGELLEKRLRGGLSEDERRELEALFAAKPDAREIAEQLGREEEAMNEAITSAVGHFDFDKARRAAEAKLKGDLTFLRFAALLGAVGVVYAAVMAWLVTNWDWPRVLAAASGPLLCLLGGLWIVVRQRSIVGSVSRGGNAARVRAYQRHLQEGRRLFTILRVSAIIAPLGAIVALIVSLTQANYWQAVLMAFMLAVIVCFSLPRLFSRTAVARHEKYLAGDLSYSAWISGKDEPR